MEIFVVKWKFLLFNENFCSETTVDVNFKKDRSPDKCMGFIVHSAQSTENSLKCALLVDITHGDILQAILVHFPQVLQ